MIDRFDVSYNLDNLKSGRYVLYEDHLVEIAEKDKEIERLREAIQTIYGLCSSREDYTPVNIEVGMTAMKALKEQP